MTAAEKVKKLLVELRLSQTEVAARAAAAGHRYDRNDVNKVCTGKNKATASRVRKALADGFGLHPLDFDAYLDDKIELSDLLRRRLLRQASSADGQQAVGPKHFGQLAGWEEAEREAMSMSISVGSDMTMLDFMGARLMDAFGVPAAVTPQFVAAVAWLWKQTATEEQRKQAAELLPKALPTGTGDRPSGPHRLGRGGPKGARR